MAKLNQSIPPELRRNSKAKIKFPYYYVSTDKGLKVIKDTYKGRKVDIRRAKDGNLFVSKSWAVRRFEYIKNLFQCKG